MSYLNKFPSRKKQTKVWETPERPRVETEDKPLRPGREEGLSAQESGVPKEMEGGGSGITSASGLPTDAAEAGMRPTSVAPRLRAKPRALTRARPLMFPVTSKAAKSQRGYFFIGIQMAKLQRRTWKRWLSGSWAGGSRVGGGRHAARQAPGRGRGRGGAWTGGGGRAVAQTFLFSLPLPLKFDILQPASICPSYV